MTCNPIPFLLYDAKMNYDKQIPSSLSHHTGQIQFYGNPIPIDKPGNYKALTS